MKFIDLFAGIGGIRMGFEQAGHKCVGYCEIDEPARKSYEAIYDTKNEWTATDIRGVVPGELPKADMYCGGFPCQSFSIAGKRGGFSDTRGTLFFEVMRLAKERQPKILLFENVKGLLSHDKGHTFEVIIRSIWECGYNAQWQVLNSKNFGVPQNRERVFIVGHLRNERRPEVFPIFGESTGTLKQVNKGAKIEGLHESACKVYSIDGAGPALNTCGGGGLETKVIIPVLTPDRIEKRQNGRRFKSNGEPMFTLTTQDRHGVAIKEATKKGYDIALPGDSVNLAMPNSTNRRGRGGKEIANTLDTSCNQGVVVIDKSGNVKKSATNNQTASCLTAGGHSGGNHSDMDLISFIPGTNGIVRTLRSSGHNTPTAKHNFDTIYDGIRIRRLTPLECWRLQGFPDWAFDKAKATGMSDTQLYKQAGNSITVNVARAIGERLREYESKNIQ